jgi:peptide/nickel transport system permease protein
MQRYIAWRLVLIAPTLLVACTLVFLVMRILPGDITFVIFGDVAVNPEAREFLRDELGLNDPLHVQYGGWLWKMVNGEFGGHSLESDEQIASMIGRQLPVTLLLTVYTVFFSIFISVPFGILSAVLEGRWPDRFIRAITLGGLALPHLLVALLLLLGLLLFFEWSPPIIYYPPWVNPWSHAQLMIWPTLILTWECSSHLVRVIRSSMLDVIRQPYVVTAQSKGLSVYRVIVWHVLPNVMIPLLTMVALQVGTLIGGVLVLEIIFGLPGLGRGFVQAAISRDYPVVQSLAVFLIFVSLIINLLVDVMYRFIDPRISYSG